MNLMKKALLLGIISFFIFLFGNTMMGNIVGLIIPGGDEFVNSYFHPLYAGITFLIATVISCTYIIVKKINLLLDKMKDQ